MATATLISLEEYLRTAYDPDCDYVDGVLEERNVGEWNHGDLQGEIVHYLKAQPTRMEHPRGHGSQGACYAGPGANSRCLRHFPRSSP